MPNYLASFSALARASKLATRTSIDISRGVYRGTKGFARETYNWVRSNYVPALKRMEPMAIAVGASTILSAATGVEAGIAGHYLHAASAIGEVVGSKYLYMAYHYRKPLAEIISTAPGMIKQVASLIDVPFLKEAYSEIKTGIKAGASDIANYVGRGKLTGSGTYAEGLAAFQKAKNVIASTKKFVTDNPELISKAKQVIMNPAFQQAAVSTAKVAAKSQTAQEAFNLVKAGQYKEAAAGLYNKGRATYEKYRNIPAHLATAGVIGAAGLIGYSGYKLWRNHQNNKDRYNTIEGLHPGSNGYSVATIQGMTDFGSGWRGIVGISSEVAGRMLGKTASAGFISMKHLKQWINIDRSSSIAGFGDLVKATTQAESRGLPGLIVVKSGIRPESLRGVLAHERFHFYSEASGASFDKPAPEAFKQKLLVNPQYAAAHKIFGDPYITEEYLAYSLQFAKSFSRRSGGLAGANQAFNEVFGVGIPPNIEQVASQVKKAGRAAISLPGALHPGNKGIATTAIQTMTDFGSPLDLGKAVLRAFGFMAKQAEKSTIVARETEQLPSWMKRHITERIASLPEGNPDELKRLPTWMKKRINSRIHGADLSEELKSRPTAGLVTNVLGDKKFHQGHTNFSGKSYT